jgi:hypothetical protein
MMMNDDLAQCDRRARTGRPAAAVLAGLLALLGGLVAPSPARAAYGLVAVAPLRQIGVATYINPLFVGNNQLFGQLTHGNFRGYLHVDITRDINSQVSGGVWVMPVFAGKRFVGTLYGEVTEGIIAEPLFIQRTVLPTATLSVKLIATKGVGIFSTSTAIGGLIGTALVDDNLAGVSDGAFPYQVPFFYGVIALDVIDIKDFSFR